MSKTEETKISRRDEEEFAKLKGFRERLWLRVQQTYDLIKGLPEKVDIFIVRADQMEASASEFNSVLAGLEALVAIYKSLAVDTKSCSSAFDNLYYAIIAERSRIKADQGKSRIEKSVGVTSQATPPSPTYLPRLQIPRFSGEIENFPGFIALYDAVIHKNHSLSDIEKYSFLLSYLDGRALKLAHTVTFDPNNYKIVYDLLRSEFSNPRVVASHYLNRIYTLSPLKTNNPEMLKDLTDSLQTLVASLETIIIPDLGRFILLHWGLRLLDSKTRQEFETAFLETDFPSFQDLIKFLRDKCTVQDLTLDKSSLPEMSQGQSAYNPRRKRVLVATHNTPPLSQVSEKLCPCCQGSHKFSHCPTLLSATLGERKNLVKAHRRCYACLGRHSFVNCKSKGKCLHCGSKSHHSLICFSQSVDSPAPKVQHKLSNVPSTSSNFNSKDISLTANSHSFSPSGSACLLGTARARIRDVNGSWHYCRLVLDPGSQVNFITSALAMRLGHRRKQRNLEISGVGNTPLATVQGIISCTLAPLGSQNSCINLDAAIVRRITSNLPSMNISDKVKERFSALPLADPEFHRSSPVDVLLGVQGYLDILPETPAHIMGQPAAISTILGWVILGSVPSPSLAAVTSLLSNTEVDWLSDSITRFWESEEVSEPRPLCSPEDSYCEEYYLKTVSRNKSGRYITRLPFKHDIRPPVLGSTRTLALTRFKKLEIRFKRDPEYYMLYKNNLRDYVERGHMIPAPRSAEYIMTHHGVVKAGPSGKKLRVVFSPAEKDSQGVSLNDTLLAGPKLQSDIGHIVTQFRFPLIAVTCDVKIMYRAILLHPDDCHFQHFFWRFSSEDPITEWELRTVTFGITSSPFLAQRTIQQLISDEGKVYPQAAEVLATSRFMDDLLFGASSEEAALDLCQELTKLMKCGGFELGKWASSCTTLLDEISTDLKELSTLSPPSPVKVLGLWWDPTSDSFCYKVDPTPAIRTKRGILSRVARMYDYNWYLSPVVFAMKVLLQILWLVKVGWDDRLPSEILEQWDAIEGDLPLLEELHIPRCILPEPYRNAQVVGFCDASIRGMATVVYLRVDTGTQVVCSLLKSKTKVAPLQGSTINRLELGAACLLTKLIRSMLPLSPTMSIEEIFLFSDSTTTLAWIRTPPYQLKPFVGNRVAQITNACPYAIWKFIPGELNIADPASRGLRASQLLRNQVWWNGPEFLSTPIKLWPKWSGQALTELPETRKESRLVFMSNLRSDFLMEFLKQFSSLLKAQRVFAYVVRFIFHIMIRKYKLPTDLFRSGPVLPSEYRDALLIFAETAQLHYYGSEISALRNGKNCSPALSPHTPFITRGFIAGGGQIATLSFTGRV